MIKDIVDAIKERRSIRKFADTPITDATISRLLESAYSAPSAGNLEPWKFIVVKQTKIKAELSQAAYGQESINGAPVCIIVCAEPNRSAAKFGQRGADLFCLQDTAAAAQNILLTATAYGLGSCWVGAFDEAAVKASLGLDSGLRPVVIIPIGYAAEKVAEMPRRPVAEVTVIM